MPLKLPFIVLHCFLCIKKSLTSQYLITRIKWFKSNQKKKKRSRCKSKARGVFFPKANKWAGKLLEPGSYLCFPGKLVFCPAVCIWKLQIQTENLYALSLLWSWRKFQVQTINTILGSWGPPRAFELLETKQASSRG